MSDVSGQAYPRFEVGKATVQDVLAEVTSLDFDEFVKLSYRTLADHRDPTEVLVQELFGLTAETHGITEANRFVAGSLTTARMIYRAAEEAGIEVRRPNIQLARPPAQRLVHAMKPDVQLDVHDMGDEFPEQPHLSEAVNGFSNTATRVGSLICVSLYAGQLIQPGRAIRLAVNGVPLSQIASSVQPQEA